MTIVVSEEIRQWARESRVRQGLPPVLEDRATAERFVAMLREPKTGALPRGGASQ